MIRFTSNNIRNAVVTDTNHSTGVSHVRWSDETESYIPVPHPYASANGEGIFVGIREGTNVAIGLSSYEQKIPLTTIPIKNMYGDVGSVEETDVYSLSYPDLEEGDIVIQGAQSGQLRFDNDGLISLLDQNNKGFVINDDLKSGCIIYNSPLVEYKVSTGGVKSFGRVRRDIKLDENDDNYIDFLSNIYSENIFEEVGRNPNDQTNIISTNRFQTEDGKQEKVFRNPTFIEDRKVILEFGREWEVDVYDEELKKMQEDVVPEVFLDERRNNRNNILSLSLTSPNELMETVSGTLVDVFGNVLDINKNIIELPVGETPEELLKDMLEKTRHSVVHYVEINTRKGLSSRLDSHVPISINFPPQVDLAENNSRDRSKWSYKIDKEGLTSMNVPSTSETGNIPLLVRHENSSVVKRQEDGSFQERDKSERKYLFRNDDLQDIFLDQFGPGGIALKGLDVPNRLSGQNTSWPDETASEPDKLPEFIEAGTAFHNITKTALNILNENINKNASDIFDSSSVSADPPAVSEEINVELPSDSTSIDDFPNAGGRSAQINLDGSLETSIGANSVDRVSWILDTAGALVARLGRDKQGRSALIQTDGSVVLEVGGWDFIGEGADDEVDMRFVGGGENRSSSLPDDQHRFKSGKVVIRIRRANPNNSGPDDNGADHLLILDETGISIESSGRLNFKSDMDMTLKSGGQLILDAEVIRCFDHNSRYITKSGRRMA